MSSYAQYIFIYALNHLSGKINGGSLNLFVDNNYLLAEDLINFLLSGILN